MTWVLDLDGVVWRGGQAVPGAAEAVGRLRDRGMPVLFVTNNSGPTLGDYVAKLATMGIAAAESEIVTSAQAAAGLLEPGQTALVCGGPGVVEALEQREVEMRDQGPVDAVVVGLTRAFDYDVLTRGTAAVLGGARLVATNDDPTYPTPDGVVPGAGALVAAFAQASGAAPEVAGKPHQPVIDLLAERAGEIAVVVGDRPSTDGALAHRVGARFALVLSGVTKEGETADPAPDLEAADLSAVVDAWT